MSTITAPEKAHPLYKEHENTLKDAIKAIHSREFYAKYPEPPSGKIYGENAQKDGLAAFKEQWGNPFKGILQQSSGLLMASEESPFLMEAAEISYPYNANIEDYISRSLNAFASWKNTDVHTRAGILVESLDRVRDRFFELSFATMHTTGQGFMMAFQASGPHSNDRALEAIALGLFEQTRFPAKVDWKKSMGKFDVELTKYYKNVPLGINLAIGCSTFPVWNTAPGIYAGLITGNTVIVKPHPKSIYPIALMVAEIQKVLKENGFDPHIIQLAPDTPEAPVTRELAMHKAVKLIDYTGGNMFGNFIESIPGKRTFTEKAGINSVVLHSAKDLKVMMQNISFSLSLYSGQMCTAPQNIFIPKDGIKVDGAQVSYEECVAALTQAVRGLVTHEQMGPGTLGAIQSEATYNRIGEAQNLGYKVLLESMKINNPEFPKARIATPSIIEVPAEKQDVFSREMFGPIAFVVPVDNARQGVQLAKNLAAEHGALTFAAYCTDTEMQDYMVGEMSETFTSVSFNFVGPIWVNQSAGFSDFHATGGNPAGNASLTDPEFILNRFEIVGVRIHA